jgi:hypothetical protein
VVPHDWPRAEATIPATVYVGPSAAAFVGAGAMRQFVLSGGPLSVPWVVAPVGHHYPRHKNH